MLLDSSLGGLEGLAQYGVFGGLLVFVVKGVITYLISEIKSLKIEIKERDKIIEEKNTYIINREREYVTGLNNILQKQITNEH